MEIWHEHWYFEFSGKTMKRNCRVNIYIYKILYNQNLRLSPYSSIYIYIYIHIQPAIALFATKKIKATNIDPDFVNVKIVTNYTEIGEKKKKKSPELKEKKTTISIWWKAQCLHSDTFYSHAKYGNKKLGGFTTRSKNRNPCI